MQVRKAVIPAAGWGTRMLPASKAVPKGLLLLLDRPMIHYIVEEVVSSGVTQIIIVTSSGKEALAAYFSPAPELERALAAKGEEHRLTELRTLSDKAEFTYVLQEEQLGLGHAVLMARQVVGDEPFAVLLPDDIILGESPALSQLLTVAREREASVVAVEEVPPGRISAYGVVRPRVVKDGLFEVLGLVEKPAPEEAPSNLGIVGRYVLTPEVFDALAHVTPGAKGELQLTDGIAHLLEEQRVYAYRVQGARHDAGNPLGLLQTAVALALRRDNLAPGMLHWLREYMGDWAC